MDDIGIVKENIVHLTRLALKGDRREVEAYARRLARLFRNSDPSLASNLSSLLANAPSQIAPMRDATPVNVPVDHESRLHLLRHEFPVVLEQRPVLSEAIRECIDQVVQEHQRAEELAQLDLLPTRTALFVGPPGVGKTLSARWIAERLNLPLLTLDLSTVMSSFLGKTGANLRAVLDFAKQTKAVLLLDEFDAIAKRRDDETELGELKRLVTVLLQEIDVWPVGGLLIAASNHGELLDPAVWRRFDVRINFLLPQVEVLRETIRSHLGHGETSDSLVQVLATLWHGKSHSDVIRSIRIAQKRAALRDGSVAASILEAASTGARDLPLKQRRMLGEQLRAAGLSERMISDATGLARDTIRKLKTGKEDASHG